MSADNSLPRTHNAVAGAGAHLLQMMYDNNEEVLIATAIPEELQVLGAL